MDDLKNQRYLQIFQNRMDELEEQKSACKDKEKLDRLEQELYAYKQEIRLLTEIKEEPKNKKRGRR